MDDIQIQNLESELVPAMKFRTREWRYMTDITNGNFTDGKLRYDSQQNLSDWIIWANAYLDLRLVFTDGGVDYTDADTRLALRNGVSSCFYSSQVTINNVVISHNQHTNDMANIRHMVSHSEDWERNHGAEEHYAVDDMKRPEVFDANIDPDAGPASLRAYMEQQGLLVERRGTVDALTADHLIVKRDDLHINEGYKKRIEMFKENAVLDGNGNYTLRVRVPLKRINSLFESFNMPMNNLRMQLVLGLCNKDNGTNQVMYTLTRQGVANDEPSIQAAGSEPALSVRVDEGWRPRLYFEVVQFDADTFERIAPLLDPSNPAPFTKSLKFHDHKYFRYNSTVAPGGQIAFAVTPGMRNVKRIWLLCRHDESVVRDSQGVSRQGATAVHPMDNHNGLGYFSRGALRNIQVQLDNKPFYPTNIEDDHQAYQLLKLAMENSGYYEEAGAPLLTFKRWRTLYRYYCFDVTRNPNVVADSAKPVSVYITADRPGNDNDFDRSVGAFVPSSYIENDNSQNINLECFIEYECDLDIDLKSGAVQVNNQ